MDTLPQPLVSPPDADGFRTFSLYTDTGEIFRVSFNVERQRDYLNRPISPYDEYSPGEQNRLEQAAQVAIARGEIPRNDLLGPEEAAIELLHEKANETALRLIEQWFPALAAEALRVATNACVKRALNQVVTEYGAPRIYDEAAFERLSGDFKTAIKEEMVIKRGHPPEGPERVVKIRQVLQQLSEKGNARPTQAEVAVEIRIEARRLRDWLSSSGVSWRQLLSDYKWQPGKRETHARTGEWSVISDDRSTGEAVGHSIPQSPRTWDEAIEQADAASR